MIGLDLNRNPADHVFDYYEHESHTPPIEYYDTKSNATTIQIDVAQLMMTAPDKLQWIQNNTAIYIAAAVSSVVYLGERNASLFLFFFRRCWRFRMKRVAQPPEILVTAFSSNSNIRNNDRYFARKRSNINRKPTAFRSGLRSVTRQRKIPPFRMFKWIDRSCRTFFYHSVYRDREFLLRSTPHPPTNRAAPWTL